MKAVWYENQGMADNVLIYGDRPVPSVGRNEVLVRMHASGCNPSDVKLRAGARPMGFDSIIPHSDGAGMIEAVGTDVDKARIGERVWLWNCQWQRSFGTCAQYIAIPTAQAVTLPESVAFEDGACLGVPAMTAYHCVYCDGPVAGKVVLVTGGAGTVARYAIQMAKLGGATVICTVSTDAKAAYARAAGADHVLNYKSDNLVEAITALTGGVDRIIELEFGANLTVSEQVINISGTIATYGSAGDMTPVLPFYPMMFKNVTLHMVLVYLLSEPARSATISGLTKMLKSGKLSHAVAASFTLPDTAKAHMLVESADKMGSVVIHID